jgi:hypothetical protein
MKSVNYDLSAKQDLEFCELAGIDISSFIREDGAFIDFSSMEKAKKEIEDNFKNEDELFDLTDNTKFEGTNYEASLEMAIRKRNGNW